MHGTLGRSMIGSLGAAALALAFSASAHAFSAPLKIGSNSKSLASPAAVAVDPTGTAYIVWDQTGAKALNFCKMAVTATACSPVVLSAPTTGHFFDPPSVLVRGTDVYVLEEVDGSTSDNDGINEWTSINGGASFTRVAHAVGTTGVSDSLGTGPQPVVPLFGSNFGISDVSAVQNPTFQANGPLSAPLDYSVATEPNPFATLNPTPNNYSVPNLGGEMVSQLTGTTGLLGVYEILEQGPCPSSDGLVFGYAPYSTATTNTELNTTTGHAGSPWRALAGVSCHLTAPALTDGSKGLGLLATDDASLLKEKTQFRKFTPPSSWGAPVTVANAPAQEPTLSQDGSGGMYGTWVNDSGVKLMYSSDGGSEWSGPATLFSVMDSAVPSALASAVGSHGQGWAIYAFKGTEYAQRFAKSDALPPQIKDLKVTPSMFKPQSTGGPIVSKLQKHTGTKVTYTDTKASKTTFKVYLLAKGYRRGKGACKALKKGQHPPKGTHSCTVMHSKGSFSHNDTAGADSFLFTGRVGGHTLGSGSYELRATPSFGGLTGNGVTAKFTVT